MRYLHLFMLATALAACSNRSSDGGAGPTPLPAERWARPFPTQKVPEGLQTLRAAECGLCHKEIYEEWRRSTHARAMIDPQFLFEWKKDDNIFLCINCHAPLQNQQDVIIEGLAAGDIRRPVSRPNPDFDPVLREEAVTCAACHVRDGAVLGPYGDQEASPHKVRKRGEGDLDPELCATCHQAEARLGGTLVCTFTTVAEWREAASATEGRSCISCHMPEVRRKNAETGVERPSNHHTWPGGGIPKLEEDDEHVRRHFVSGLEVEMRAVTSTRAPNGPPDVEVRVKNGRAGHALPTGDVERFIIVRIEVAGGAGVLAEREERIGQRWEWWPEPRRVSDNRLKPHEERVYRLACPACAGAKDAKMRVIVTNHRMTEEVAKAQNLLGTYPIAREVFRSERPLISAPGSVP